MVQTVRISPESDAILEELHSLTGKSKIEVITAALELYRHGERLRLFNESYKKYRSDPSAWAEEIEEKKELGRNIRRWS